MSRKSPLFHRAHYNIIAAQFREHLKELFESGDYTSVPRYAMASFHYNLMLSMARRFKEDNENFDPIRFLDACSPYPDVAPLSELWEGEDGN